MDLTYWALMNYMCICITMKLIANMMHITRHGSTVEVEVEQVRPFTKQEFAIHY